MNTSLVSSCIDLAAFIAMPAHARAQKALGHLHRTRAAAVAVSPTAAF